MLWSKPNQDIVGSLQSIRMTSLKDGMNQDLGHTCRRSPVTFYFIGKRMERTRQSVFCVVIFTFTLKLLLVPALITAAHPEGMKVTPTHTPLMLVTCMPGNTLNLDANSSAELESLRIKEKLLRALSMKAFERQPQSSLCLFLQ